MNSHIPEDCGRHLTFDDCKDGYNASASLFGDSQVFIELSEFA